MTRPIALSTRRAASVARMWTHHSAAVKRWKSCSALPAHGLDFGEHRRGENTADGAAVDGKNLEYLRHLGAPSSKYEPHGGRRLRGSGVTLRRERPQVKGLRAWAAASTGAGEHSVASAEGGPGHPAAGAPAGSLQRPREADDAPVPVRADGTDAEDVVVLRDSTTLSLVTFPTLVMSVRTA